MGFFDDIFKGVNKIASDVGKAINSPVVSSIAGMIPGVSNILGIAKTAVNVVQGVTGGSSTTRTGVNAVRRPAVNRVTPVRTVNRVSQPYKSVNTMVRSGNTVRNVGRDGSVNNRPVPGRRRVVRQTPVRPAAVSRPIDSRRSVGVNNEGGVNRRRITKAERVQAWNATKNYKGFHDELKAKGA